MSYGFRIMVTGDYACFTRPEMKVERVSYDVPTPSALEGMLKSIYWKPAIRYVIDKIIVFNPISFGNIRRNEIKEKISFANVKKQMNGAGEIEFYATDNRSQRATMLLQNVRYGIEFHFELTGLRNDEEDDGGGKHYNIIKRRLEKGQCFRTPCLGCSEFPVKSITLTDEFPVGEIAPEILSMGDVDLGFMLYGVKFDDGGKPLNGDLEKPQFSDKATAIYYRPHLVDGVIDVVKYREVQKC